MQNQSFFVSSSDNEVRVHLLLVIEKMKHVFLIIMIIMTGEDPQHPQA